MLRRAVALTPDTPVSFTLGTGTGTEAGIGGEEQTENALMAALIRNFVQEPTRAFYASDQACEVHSSKGSIRLIAQQKLEALLNTAMHNYRANNDEVLLGSRIPSMAQWTGHLEQAGAYDFHFLLTQLPVRQQ